MKERPILYSSPMVLALLAGRKTQTRRALKVQPIDVLPMDGDDAGRLWVALMHRGETITANRGNVFRSRFGVPGDRLWGRETFGVSDDREDIDMARALRDAKEQMPWASVIYRADANGSHALSHLVDGKWRPSIFMPRWASRLLHEVTSVRVERLLDITEADAIAEGILPDHRPGGARADWQWPGSDVSYPTAREAYLAGWDWLNGEGAAALNPYVWVVAFRPVTP